MEVRQSAEALMEELLCGRGLLPMTLSEGSDANRGPEHDDAIQRRVDVRPPDHVPRGVKGRNPRRGRLPRAISRNQFAEVEGDVVMPLELLRDNVMRLPRR